LVKQLLEQAIANWNDIKSEKIEHALLSACAVISRYNASAPSAPGANQMALAGHFVT
jgi:hypothetical protein